MDPELYILHRLYERYNGVECMAEIDGIIYACTINVEECLLLKDMFGNPLYIFNTYKVNRGIFPNDVQFINNLGNH